MLDSKSQIIYPIIFIILILSYLVLIIAGFIFGANYNNSYCLEHILQLTTWLIIISILFIILPILWFIAFTNHINNYFCEKYNIKQTIYIIFNIIFFIWNICGSIFILINSTCPKLAAPWIIALVDNIISYIYLVGLFIWYIKQCNKDIPQQY